MIRLMREEEIPVCVALIRRSFGTVAEEFGFTEENAPRFTAFATTEERLTWHLHGEKRPMYVYVNESGEIIGYYSLLLEENNVCELSNLCVAPESRHGKVGEALLLHSYEAAKDLFVLHEGTKVKVIDSVGSWNNIELADGRQGWIPSSDIEMI